jgi:hypothetical protein
VMAVMMIVAAVVVSGGHLVPFLLLRCIP